MYLAIDEKGNDPCIWIEHSIFNVNKIGVILTLVCVDQRYPAALKRSELNYLGVGCFPRPLVKGSEDTGYEVVAQYGKFKLLNHCSKICFDQCVGFLYLTMRAKD